MAKNALDLVKVSSIAIETGGISKGAVFRARGCTWSEGTLSEPTIMSYNVRGTVTPRLAENAYASKYSNNTFSHFHY